MIRCQLHLVGQDAMEIEEVEVAEVEGEVEVVVVVADLRARSILALEPAYENHDGI